ncbi:ABC transporter permease [Hoyosella altamirensis]|uniref:NitT/TauT family transport system permease protein n=1 Tax=Hoyosella altamirensis TaxID=616997 RepID=A0A839RJE8_9ACTN|nr:ABC transporter permease subunit [Hoyosella altamirensis]MBB3036795.1 NitT/TauT family transport system permease protein [Hoyosella altamirensis]
MKLIREPLSIKQQVAYGVAGTIGISALTEGLLRSPVIDKPGLPIPSAVLSESIALLGNSAFMTEVWFTMRQWALGLLIAAIAGVVLGGLMGAFRKVFIAFELPVEFFRPLPSIAIGPILVLVLGAGMLPLSLTVAIACMWPILLNTMYGVRGTDLVAVQTARTFGESALGVFARIKLPSALPFAFTGMRVAASIGLIVAVSAELLIGSGDGIGGFILLHGSVSTDMDPIYAATLIAGVIGVLVSLLFVVIDSTLFRWKKGLAQ